MSVKINELDLPEELLEAINDGLSTTAIPAESWCRLFPRADVVRPRMYSIEAMQINNRDWYEQADPVYLGQAGGLCSPGDINPRLSLLIGELEPETPIALDYRCSGNCPIVVYLTCAGFESGWKCVAPSVGAFVSALMKA